jgi:hypothetical protein
MLLCNVSMCTFAVSLFLVLSDLCFGVDSPSVCHSGLLFERSGEELGVKLTLFFDRLQNLGTP